MATTIEWTDATWNTVTGCTKISPGCKHCYAERLTRRLMLMGEKTGSTKYANGFNVTLHPDVLEAPLHWKRSRRIFVNSMSDLFHVEVPDEFILQVFDVMRRAPQHTYQVLTKRPENAVGWWYALGQENLGEWPASVWMGTSVELFDYTERLDALAHLPAPVRFLSAEPLLGALDITTWLENGVLDWVIAGGESGPGCRPMELDWARDLRDQCAEANVPFFLKQLGGTQHKRGGSLAVLDGALHHEFPA